MKYNLKESRLPLYDFGLPIVSTIALVRQDAEQFMLSFQQFMLQANNI